MIKVPVLIFLISVLPVSILTGLIGRSSRAELTSVKLSITHSVSVYCMHASTIKGDDGKFTLSGYIYDMDGNMYETDGLAMSSTAVEKLLAFTNGEMKSAGKTPKFHADDAPTKKLELTYADGKRKSFTVTDDMEQELREIFLPEFKDSCPEGR